MSTQVQFRKGNTAQTALFTGAVAEITVDTDKKTLVVHDGVTTGGVSLAKEDVLNSAFNQANLAYDAANTAATSGQANVGAGLISTTDSITTAYQANVGSAIAQGQANVGAGLISSRIILTNNYEANVGLGLISTTTAYEANVGSAIAQGQANVGAGLITTSTTLLNGYQANVGAGLIAVTSAYQANVGAGLISAKSVSEANVGIGLLNAKTVSEANVGAGLIGITNALTSAYQANVGAGLISAKSVSEINVGSAIAQGEANVGSGLIVVTGAYQTNVGAGLIATTNSLTNAYQANVGAGLITEVASRQANVGAGLISAKSVSEANVGAGLIAYQTTSQANVGAGLIAVTGAYQANVGSARITDTASGQANVGAGLIAVTDAYQANVGAGLISAKSVSEANVGSAIVQGEANVGAGLISAKSVSEANVGAGLISAKIVSEANVGSGLITVTNRTNSSFNQANLAYNQANSGTGIATSSFGQANLAYDKANSATILAQGAYDAANNVAPQIQPTYDKANNAFAQANLAYNYANTRFASAGGTVSGFVNVTGNVTVGSYIDMNTVPSKPSYSEGRVFYDNEQKALAYYNESDMTGQILQESVIRVYNQTGATISDGKAVYISGPSSANGFPSVALANAAIYDSSEVIGITTTVIANSGYGYVTSMGKVNGLDTHLITAGDEVYLSATDPGAWTTTKPASPASAVRLGVVANSDLTNGSILVDVTFREGANKTSGAVLFALDESVHEDPTKLFYDHTNHRLGVGTNTPTANLHVAGDALFTANVQINGNLIISNAQSISTTTLTVGGNTIVLNDTTTGSPVSNAEIRVNRGNSANVYIKWDENIDEWIMYEAGAYPSGHILHSEKTAKTWADYAGWASYEKSTHPIGADLANSTNELAKTAFDQANTGLGIATSAFGQANLAYNAANTAVTSGQANVGAGLISTTSAYQANVGAGLITYQTTSQANVGAGLITEVASRQANVGAGLITVTGRVNSAFGQANLAYNQANSAFDGANTKVSKTGDTMSGALIVSSITSNTGITVGSSSIVGLTSNTYTTSSTSEVSVDAFSASTYRSAKYFVQMTSSTSYHVIELILTHDGTTVYIAQYGEIYSGSSLGTFNATITGGILNLLFTPANSVTTVKLTRTTLVV